tara:strand:- start:606 stop:758 length:153 start_codon:yes stop_codon:yes gene_type:complete
MAATYSASFIALIKPKIVDLIVSGKRNFTAGDVMTVDVKYKSPYVGDRVG